MTPASSSTTPTSSRPPSSTQLGQTDLNLYAPLSSAQGYTALTQGTYYDATGAHFQEDLDPSTLAGRTWDDLNVSTLLSLPDYFLTPFPRPAPGPTVPRMDAVHFPAHPDVYTSAADAVARSYPVVAPGCPAPGTSAVCCPWARSPSRSSTGGPTISGPVWSPPAVGSTGCPPPTSPRSGRVATPRSGSPSAPRSGPRGSSSGRSASGRATVGTPTAFTAQAGEVALDGRMQYGVTTPHWVFTGMLGAFAVFHDTDARGWAWVRSPRGDRRARQ